MPTKIILFFILGLIVALPIISLAAPDGTFVLDNGNTYEAGAMNLNYTDTCTNGECSQHKHSLFNVDTNVWQGRYDGGTGNITDTWGAASTTGNYSFVQIYNGDTSSACMTGSGGYTACVSATFPQEYLFEVTESTSTASSTVTMNGVIICSNEYNASGTIATSTCSSPMYNYIEYTFDIIIFFACVITIIYIIT